MRICHINLCLGKETIYLLAGQTGLYRLGWQPVYSRNKRQPTVGKMFYLIINRKETSEYHVDHLINLRSTCPFFPPTAIS